MAEDSATRIQTAEARTPSHYQHHCYQPLAAGTVFTLKCNPAVTFAIPPRRIKMGSMRKITPDAVTAQGMHTQLKNVGLDCPDTQPSALEPTVKTIETRLKGMAGASSAFLIDKLSNDSYGRRMPTLVSQMQMGVRLAEVQPVAQGEWEPSQTALGYSADLAIINAHFDDLYDNYPGFKGVGHKGTETTKDGYYETTDAIASMFESLAIKASAEIVTGINEPSMSATISNIIAPELDGSISDYNKTDDRVIFVVFNYNELTGEADGVGFITLDWTLKIKDYKKKSKDTNQHETTLTMRAQSAVYSDIAALDAHVAWANARRQTLSMYAIPPKNNFKIFPSLPSANAQTWLSALLLESRTEKLTGLVFYAADLVCLGNLDNKASQASSSYEVSTTSGFTFSMEQKIGTEVKVEAGVIFAKAEVSMSMELSFTEQWNKSVTETVHFEIPAQSQSFVYKGYVMTRYIYFEPSSNKYSYGTVGKFYTNYLVTSEKPLTGQPIYSG